MRSPQWRIKLRSELFNGFSRPCHFLEPRSSCHGGCCGCVFVFSLLVSLAIDMCENEFEDEDEDEDGGGCGVVDDEFGCVSDEGKKTCKEKCVVEMKPVWKNRTEPNRTEIVTV